MSHALSFFASAFHCLPATLCFSHQSILKRLKALRPARMRIRTHAVTNKYLFRIIFLFFFLKPAETLPMTNITTMKGINHLKHYN